MAKRGSSFPQFPFSHNHDPAIGRCARCIARFLFAMMAAEAKTSREITPCGIMNINNGTSIACFEQAWHFGSRIFQHLTAHRA